MRFVFFLALSLGLLGCNKSSQSSSSQPTPSPAPSKSQAEASPAAGNSAPVEKKPEEWTRSEETDQMDGHKKVAFTIHSTNNIHYFTGGESPAKITLSCDKDVNVLLEPGSPTGLVRYKFDESVTEAVSWYGDSHLLLSGIDSDELRLWMRAKTFKIEFTPGSAVKQIVTFDLRNLKELIQNEKACNFLRKASRF
jgi:hypothetical protein